MRQKGWLGCFANDNVLGGGSVRFQIISHVGTEGVTMLGKKCTIRESGKKNLKVVEFRVDCWGDAEHLRCFFSAGKQR